MTIKFRRVEMNYDALPDTIREAVDKLEAEGSHDFSKLPDEARAFVEREIDALTNGGESEYFRISVETDTGLSREELDAMSTKERLKYISEKVDATLAEARKGDVPALDSMMAELSEALDGIDDENGMAATAKQAIDSMLSDDPVGALDALTKNPVAKAKLVERMESDLTGVTGILGSIARGYPNNLEMYLDKDRAAKLAGELYDACALFCRKYNVKKYDA